jgi:hypothetical protein
MRRHTHTKVRGKIDRQREKRGENKHSFLHPVWINYQQYKQLFMPVKYLLISLSILNAVQIYMY